MYAKMTHRALLSEKLISRKFKKSENAFVKSIVQKAAKRFKAVVLYF